MRSLEELKQSCPLTARTFERRVRGAISRLQTSMPLADLAGKKGSWITNVELVHFAAAAHLTFFLSIEQTAGKSENSFCNRAALLLLAVEEATRRTLEHCG